MSTHNGTINSVFLPTKRNRDGKNGASEMREKNGSENVHHSLERVKCMKVNNEHKSGRTHNNIVFYVLFEKYQKPNNV